MKGSSSNWVSASALSLKWLLLAGAVMAGVISGKGAETLSTREKAGKLSWKTSTDRPVLDVGRLKERDLKMQDAEKEALAILNSVLRDGDSYEAVHVLTYARVKGDKALVNSIRQRLKKEDASWSGQHVKLGAVHALAVLSDDNVTPQVQSFIDSDDETLRVRAYAVVRDSKNKSLVNAIESRIRRGERPDIEAVALSAIAATEGKESAASKRLKRIAADGQDEPQKAKAKREVAVLEGRQTPEALTREEEEKLKLAAVSDRHDERMFAIEEIAKRGSEGSRGWLRALGESEDWRHRLASAYYLLVSNERDEAKGRLLNEQHSLVQITLVSAVRSSF